MRGFSNAVVIDAHPADIVDRCNHKLQLLNTLIRISGDEDEGAGINLNNKTMSSGLYWLIDGIAHELEFAADEWCRVSTNAPSYPLSE